MENLRSRTEKMYVTASPEELRQQEESGLDENTIIQQQKRLALAKSCTKLNYRSAALRVALSIVFLPYLQEKFDSPEDRTAMEQKVSLIYQRLMQTILKIDLIDNKSSGEDNFTDSLNSDLRLQQKFDNFKTLWEGTPTEQQYAKQRNWISVVEAVERDITQLNNDYKFKKISMQLEERYQNQKIDLNDLFQVEFEATGPWRTLAQNIRTEL